MSHSGETIKIGDLAKQLGISTRTIRYYEEVGLMENGRKLANNVRHYSSEDVIRLKFILKLKELGISLKEMQEIAVYYELNEKSTGKILPQLIDILDNHINNVNDKIEKLITLRKDIVEYRSRVAEYLKQNEQYSTAG